MCLGHDGNPVAEYRKCRTDAALVNPEFLTPHQFLRIEPVQLLTPRETGAETKEPIDHRAQSSCFIIAIGLPMMSLNTQFVTRSSRVNRIDVRGWVTRIGLLFTLVAAFTTTWGQVYLASLQISDVFLVLALGSLIPAWLISGTRISLPWWVWMPVVALLCCVVTRLMKPIPNVYYAARYQLLPELLPSDFSKVAIWILALLGVPLCLVICTALEVRALRWVLISFSAGISVSCLIALSDLSGLTNVATSLGWESNSSRQPGLTSHPNTLGFVCVLTTPLALYFMSSPRRRAATYGIITLVIYCVGVVASGSRGAQVALPLAVLFTLALTPQRRILTARLTFALATAVALGAILLVVVLPSSFTDELFRFGGTGSADQSDSDRSVLAKQALGDFTAHPLVGIGIRHITDAHDIYLQVLSAGGIILTVAMAAYWVGLVRGCVLLRRARVDLAPYLMSSVAVWLVLGVLENEVADRFLYYLPGCVIALLSIRARHDETAAQISADDARRQPGSLPAHAHPVN